MHVSLLLFYFFLVLFVYREALSGLTFCLTQSLDIKLVRELAEAVSPRHRECLLKKIVDTCTVTK